ncbi:MAG TPA: RNA polymerase factor sigma-54 [Thermomicrobiales bacterium]|nr:RNA polymerase factor sigma-54 [Thermomicrobiales bacterium]
MARMEAGYDLNLEQRQWVSPSLIEANYILSLSRQELEAVINQELDSNPALEVSEEQVCPRCGGVLEGAFCPTCMINHAEQPERESWEDFPETAYQTSVTRDDSDEFDPMTLVGDSVSLRDRIALDLPTLVGGDLRRIAEYLLDSLDERGYVDADMDDVADQFDVDPADVEQALVAVQTLAPVGVGARDLRECLLLQLHHLEDSDHEIPPCVEEIVDQYLDELGAHKFGLIARDLGVTAEVVEAARDFIRSNLTPFPLQSQEAQQWRTPVDDGYVAPDVVISIKDGELIIEVVESRHSRLRVNDIYDQMARVALANRKTSEMDAETRAHVRDHVSRARLFLGNVKQRHETLARISRCVADMQEDFLRGGVRKLVPLTRATVAQQVGVHESTVSRATANKFVMLPTRQVIPFSDFFTPSLSVKDMIKEMIEKEEQSLTDKRIVELLNRRGVRIARRTVAKYRAELNILPSTLR